MDSLDPPDEKPPGESALLQQVAVQMRKPFEPDDTLPDTTSTMVLEMVGERRDAKKEELVAALTAPPPHPAHVTGVAPVQTEAAEKKEKSLAVQSAKAAAAKESPSHLGADKDKADKEEMSVPMGAVDITAGIHTAHSLLESSKHETLAKAKKSEAKKTNGSDSLTLQMLAESKERYHEHETGTSDVNKSATRSRDKQEMWLEMLHIGQSLRTGRAFITMETILLFCAMSLVIGLLIWGVMCIWGQGTVHHEEVDAPRMSEKGPGRDRQAYAQPEHSRSMPQNSAGSIQPHHEAPPGSGRLSAFPSVNKDYHGATQKEPYKEAYPAPGPSEMPVRSLCPELIVPRGSECILVVHYLPPGQTQQVEFDILDINGEPVLKVEMQPIQPGQLSDRLRHGGKHMVSSQRNRSPTIVLKSLQPRETTGGFVFAYCRVTTKDDDMGTKQQNVYIYKEDDELYAHLMKDEQRKRYVLTSGHHGLQLLFEGNFEEHVVNVTNESGERIAATEPRVMHFDPTKFYKLRVAANADVGLVLCGLLMINQLEFGHVR